MAVVPYISYGVKMKRITILFWFFLVGLASIGSASSINRPWWSESGTGIIALDADSLGFVNASGDTVWITSATGGSGGGLDSAQIMDVVQDSISGDITLSAASVATLGADAVEEANIADNGIDSEHYNDGSIDAAHLAADIVDETKIADNGIDSEHYNDGSIDAAHLANDVKALIGDSVDLALRLADTGAYSGTIITTAYDSATTFLDGMAYDKPAITIVQAAGFWVNVEKLGGGDMDFHLDGVVSTLECTSGAGVGGKARVAITAGSNANTPQTNYLYVTNTGGTATLTASTSLPTGSFGWIGKVIVLDTVSHNLYGAIGYQRYTESETYDSRGLLSHEREKLRALGAVYISGCAPTFTIWGTPDPDTLHLDVAAGAVYQLHRQTFPSYLDGPYYYGNGADIYEPIGNLNECLEEQDETSLSGKRFNLVIWGAVNYSTGDCKLFVNLPNGSYTNNPTAMQDRNNTADYSVPDDMRSVAFLIARVALRHTTTSSGTWAELATYNLLGTPLGVRTGGASSGDASSEFDDNLFRVYDETDPTKVMAFQNSGITTGNTRTLTIPDANGTIALTSNLTSYLPLAGGTMTGSIIGIDSLHVDSGLYVTDDITAIGNIEGQTLRSGGSLYANYDYTSGDEDALVYFNASGEFLQWNYGESAFRLSDDFDVSGALSAHEIILYDANSSPDTVGELLYDNSVTGIEDGALAWYDDDEIRYLVDLDALPTNDDYVVSYDATNSKFYMKEDGGGSGSSLWAQSNDSSVLVDADDNDTVMVITDDNLDAVTWTIGADQASLTIDGGGDELRVDDPLHVEGDIYVNKDSTDADAVIYFGDNDEVTSLHWDDANDQFEFSDNISVTGDVTSDGNFFHGDTTAGDVDVFSYFSTNGSWTTEYMKWDDGAGEFQISNDLGANGAITVGNNMDTETEQVILNFGASGAQEYIRYDGATDSRFEVSAGVDVTGNISVSGTVDAVNIAALNTGVATDSANWTDAHGWGDWDNANHDSTNFGNATIGWEDIDTVGSAVTDVDTTGTEIAAALADRANIHDTLTKSFVIKDIEDGDDFPLWMTPKAITLIAVSGHCLGGTDVDGCLMEYDGDAANPVVCNSSDWTFTANEERTTSISNASIDAGDYLGWKTTDIDDDDVDFLTITFEYTVD